MDYPAREALLHRIEQAGSAGVTKLLRELLAAPEDGAIKLLPIHRVLGARAKAKQLFDSGDYFPLSVHLPHPGPAGPTGSWPPPAGWVDAITGSPVPGGTTLMARDLFGSFPGALLLPAD